VSAVIAPAGQAQDNAAMLKALVRIVIGYAVASAAAAAVLVIQLPLIAGGEMLGFRDYLAATAVIGVFAWAGFLFAIRAYIMEWTHPTTFALGGLIAMLVGVATLMGFGAAQSLLQGYSEWSVADAASFLLNLVQLVLLGVLPGLAGGWTFWLIAGPKAKVSAI
jgi:hypothetical protein